MLILENIQKMDTPANALLLQMIINAINLARTLDAPKDTVAFDYGDVCFHVKGDSAPSKLLKIFYVRPKGFKTGDILGPYPQ